MCWAEGTGAVDAGAEGTGVVDAGVVGSRAADIEAEGTGVVDGVFGSDPPLICGEVAVH